MSRQCDGARHSSQCERRDVINEPALSRAENTVPEKTGNGIFRPGSIGPIVDRSDAGVQSVATIKKLRGTSRTRVAKIRTRGLARVTAIIIERALAVSSEFQQLFLRVEHNNIVIL